MVTIKLALKIARKNAVIYSSSSTQQNSPALNIVKIDSSVDVNASNEPRSSASETCSAAIAEKYMFCGNKRHARKFCPARAVVYFKCAKRHFSKMRRSSSLSESERSVNAMLMEIETKPVHSKVNIPVLISGIKANALLDTGSTWNYISGDLSNRLRLELKDFDCYVGLAVKGCSSKCVGRCQINVDLNGQNYKNVPFTVLNDLLADVVLGQDLMNKHQNINIHLGGPMPTLHIGALNTVKTSALIRFFQHLKTDCKPIATKSRRYSHADSEFISSEVKRLLREGLIESSSNSPWRAQPLVVTQENHKKRATFVSCLILIITSSRTRFDNSQLLPH